MRDDRERDFATGWQADLGSYGQTSSGRDARGAQDPDVDSEAGEPFVIDIKGSALEQNEAAAELASERGEILEYQSRRAAAQKARALSTIGDTRVCLQGVAPQDDTNADAYLVAQPRRHVETPYDSDRNGMCFDISGNQYGAIAEALLSTPGKNPPALTYYVRNDLDVKNEVRVEIDRNRCTSFDVDMDDGRRRATWEADLVATAYREATGASLREYWCEIKSGGGSFERNQKAVMRAKARDSDVSVLRVRVDIESLPDQYTVRIDQVGE